VGSWCVREKGQLIARCVLHGTESSRNAFAYTFCCTPFFEHSKSLFINGNSATSFLIILWSSVQITHALPLNCEKNQRLTRVGLFSFGNVSQPRRCRSGPVLTHVAAAANGLVRIWLGGHPSRLTSSRLTHGAHRKTLLLAAATKRRCGAFHETENRSNRFAQGNCCRSVQTSVCAG
jgi:hypothetical protein